ncbi:MAG: hypothetical protein K2K38_05410 [Clostridia bacterium]|nr:hypothetical protein [Clostridia bacterium]
MKKIIKGLSILVASTALCAGVAMATACDSGYNGTYEGEYHYPNAWAPTAPHYGMKVRVTVENNIITKVEDITKDAYTVVSSGWEDKNTWITYESLLLQKYEGWSVADVLAIKVYIDENGQPYGKGDNAALLESDLLIPNATQGSGRLILAVQDALGKKTQIGRIETAE